MAQNSISNKVGSATNTNPLEIEKSASGLMINMDDQTDTFGYYNNAGSPEGVLVADIGSLCLDTTNGIVYVKQTDTVNTGWAPVGGTQGQVVQIVEGTSTTAATTAATFPIDNTPPTTAEGTLYQSLVYTPLSATNIMHVEFFGWGTSSLTSNVYVAVCDSSSANSFAAAPLVGPAGGSVIVGTLYTGYSRVTGGVAPITITVRFAGADGSTVDINGVGGVHVFGSAGIATIRVTEYLP